MYKSTKKSIKFCFFIISMGIILFNSLPVVAHSTLESSSPKANETLNKPPSNIEIWFQDPVEIHQDSIKVFGSNGKLIEVSKTHKDPKDQGHIMVNLNPTMMPGKYSVKVNVIAQDGYVINESFNFNIKDSINQDIKELELLETNISDGEIYKNSPKQIELKFNQPAEVKAFGLFDKNYNPVGTGSPEIDKNNPKHITVPIPQRLSFGTYKISWFASPTNSEDQSHSRMGVYYFAINEFSPMTPINQPSTASNWNLSNLYIELNQIAYWLMFIGMTMLFGLSFFYNVILRKKDIYVSYNKSTLLLYILSLMGMGLLIYQFKQSLSVLTLKDFVSIKFIWIPFIQISFITFGLFFRKIRPLLFGIALVLSIFIIGHASYPRYGGYLTMIFASIHLIAAGAWIGGLYGLIIKPKHIDSREWFRSAGPIFSKWALISIFLVAITGIIMTNQMLPSFTIKSLVKSEWGIALSVKVILFIFIIIFGYLQRRSIKSDVIKVNNLILKRGRIEFVYGLLIIFLAASLIASNPSAAEKGIYSEQTNQEDIDVNVDITPLEMGVNTITLDFYNNPDIKGVEVELSMPPTWRIKNKAFKVDEGVYKLTGNLLHASGTIDMKVLIKMENGDIVRLPYKVVVPGEVRINE